MKESPRKVLWALAGALSVVAGLSATSGIARADQALLIGINNYPNLKDANLQGCVNDARSMEKMLKAKGFATTMILNEQATRNGIGNALDAMARKVKPNERFVLFYAGHGARAAGGTAVLLPNDAQEGEERNDFPAQLLYSKIQAIPARSRTVLLDSCFSGGMSRSIRTRKLRKRYYQRKLRTTQLLGDAKDLVMVKANRRDNNDDLTNKPDTAPNTTPQSGSTICYFTASRGNEEAGEDEFNGERHGVFTHYLLQQMSKLSDFSVPWNAVQPPVSSSVISYMEDTQHPTLSSAFVNTLLFEPSTDAAPVPVVTPAPIVTPQPTPLPPQANPVLSLSITPSSFAESGGRQAALATVSRNTATTNPLVVNLASSDTSEVSVPVSIVIPRGQTSATFFVSAVDDTFVDASQQATVTASAPGFTSATINLTITDNDVPSPTPAPAPRPSNLWDDFNGDHVDRSKLLVAIDPDRTEFRMGEQLSFRVHVGTPGYLVLIEHGTSGKLNLIYPLSGQVDDAYVAGVTRIPRDEEWVYTLDQPGVERLRAILFSSKERAQELLSRLPRPGQGKAFSDVASDLRLVRTSVPLKADFYTSDVIFTALPKDGTMLGVGQ